mmetsp:Transcript_2886/g.10461  ORF Transcript_2886/g.10461 Transcript_2886/m.10461 type:complete len:89 (-) Transcript_2886:1839-2105(-)
MSPALTLAQQTTSLSLEVTTFILASCTLNFTRTTSSTCLHREMEPELVTKDVTYCATVDTAIGEIWCLLSHASSHFLNVQIGLIALVQ